ncbi:hypothetical protein Pmar_PMAR027632 [Perkinsus marinus ATCC 50983]|uniref:Uncharacterized protein n=1 Tax=Perkinsus marinus (strain ATCC 50983 / TXsc) TaxID=423536 RepID=C5KCA3_PERM5|nr:hypothetical protein Pmar_PMAR027632 [Perkinsus marinus ATCC 50983]EER17916.1 hypothetical protein Pmar_PMAR027632 [Perkinsus marinus ATCC 50983]|eukprot:XP_002786120.1 hypothetical protein Pmar_PMAR027632 [Perkinsus marinus ATCC 50983]
MVRCFSDLVASGTMCLLKQWLPCAAHRLHLTVCNGLALYKTRHTKKAGIYGHKTVEDGLAQAEEVLKEMDAKESIEGDNSTNVNTDALLMEAEEDIEQGEPDWGLEGDDEAFRDGIETAGRGRKATLKCLEALNLDTCEDTEKKTSGMDLQQKPVDSFDSLINDFFDQPANHQHQQMSAEERYEDEMMTIFCEYEMRARSFAVPSDSSSPPKKKTKPAERDAKSSRYERFWIRCDDLSATSCRLSALSLSF